MSEYQPLRRSVVGVNAGSCCWLLLCAQRKIGRHDDHEQKHGTYRPKKKAERRLRNYSSTAFARFCHRSELQVDGLVPKQPCLRSQNLGMLPNVERQSDGSRLSSQSACAHPEQMFEVASYYATIHMDPKMEATMPVLLWLLGVPLVVVVALMLTHVI